ncbi:MAG: FtsW/RodA/SpoVE family cell cycle protein, partial [Akkermansiaceae bacterium]|nr:FtsW/RodA/SpoVE family cell cycle protein [Akkermansiaceae bacterium]
FLTALIDYRWLKWLGIPMYGVGITMLVVMLGSGNETHQLTVAGFTFQPTQIVIAAGIIMIGLMFESLPKLHRFFAWPIVRLSIIGLLCGVPFLLVAKAGDMGSAIVWLPVAVVAMLVGGIPFRYLLFIGLIAVGTIPPVYYVGLPLLSERGSERVQQYLDILEKGHVEFSPENYAPYYVTMAVGKAGWKGIGWAAQSEQSVHNKKYVPWTTAHNDYIFAVIAEEQGFRGSLLLITAFTLLLIQCLFIAFYSRDFSGQIIAAGVVALFFAHIFENIGMCVLLMPITGIPLPLISYSGTFVLICMLLLGFVQSVWVHRNTGGDDPDAEAATA